MIVWCSRGVKGLRHPPLVAAVRTNETSAIPALGSFALALSAACTRPRTQEASPGRCTACQHGVFHAAEGAKPGRLRGCGPPASPLLRAGRVQERLLTRLNAAKGGNAARRWTEGRVRPWGARSARNVRSCAAGGVRHATRGGVTIVRREDLHMYQ